MPGCKATVNGGLEDTLSIDVYKREATLYKVRSNRRRRRGLWKRVDDREAIPKERMGGQLEIVGRPLGG